MPNILNRYVRKIVLLNISLVFLVLMSLSIIIKVFDELRHFKNQTCFISKFLFCIILNLPKEFDLFLPISILLGGILALSLFEERQELIIMQVFGLSKIQIAFSVVKASLFVLLFNIISNEWIIPYTHKLITIYRDDEQYNTYLFSQKNINLWFINNNNFICIEKMLSPQELLGITLYYFTKDRKIYKLVYSEQALYINNHWVLLNLTELDFSEKECISKNRISCRQWDTLLTPKLLYIMNIHPKVLSISNLKHCIQYFDKVGQNTKYYQLIFWNKILAPIIGLLMIIIALLYSWGPLYKKKINTKFFFGSVIGFIFYILYQVCGMLSITYNVSPFVGSVSLVVLFVVINAIVLWKYS